jgi:hypothetical protein
MKQLLRSGFIALLMFGICLPNCVAETTHEQPANPKFAAIQNISVLPIVDARAGRKTYVKMEAIQEIVVGRLKKKYYSAAAAATSGEAGEIAIEDMDSPRPAYVKTLGPANERWVLVIVLTDVNSGGLKNNSFLGSLGSSNAELSGFLFDKEKGVMIWTGSGTGRRKGHSDLSAAERSATIGVAVRALFSQMPEHPKPAQ